MKSIKTVEDARKLPERISIGYSKELINGREILQSYFRDVVAVELEDDTILAFEDTDGRMMSVAYDSEGAYKYAL